MTKEDIKAIIEQFIAWNGEHEPIDVSNLDSAVDEIYETFKVKEPLDQKGYSNDTIESMKKYFMCPKLGLTNKFFCHRLCSKCETKPEI